MILPKSNRLSPEQVAEITAIVAEFGCRIQPIVGAVRTIYAIVGDERDELMINRLEGLDYIDRIDRTLVVLEWPIHDDDEITNLEVTLKLGCLLTHTSLYNTELFWGNRYWNIA